jgi:hypothetical protein
MNLNIKISKNIFEAKNLIIVNINLFSLSILLNFIYLFN